MPAAHEASMPGDLDLPAGYIIQVEAISPTTGNTVSGVTVQNYALLVDDVAPFVDDSGSFSSGPFMLVPGPEDTTATASGGIGIIGQGGGVADPSALEAAAFAYAVSQGYVAPSTPTGGADPSDLETEAIAFAQAEGYAAA